MLTPEERQELERQRSAAKLRCKECWSTLQQLSRIAKSYLREHDRWRERYEKADRELAMEDKLTVIPLVTNKKKKQSVEQQLKLTKEQVMNLAEELGIDI